MVLAFFAAMAAARSAAAEQLAIKIYNIEAGLAHNRVKRIVRCMVSLVSTADGLSRFDGTHNYEVRG
jgi:hypothetical protein